MADVAIVSVISAAAATTVVAVAGLGFNWWDSRERRRHEERLARGQRHFDARRVVYVDILSHFYRLQVVMSRTEPLFVDPSTPPPPDPPREEESLRLAARTAVLGSTEVNDAVDVCLRAYRTWWFLGVNTYQQLKKQFGEQDPRTSEAHLQMHALSERFNEVVKTLEALAQTELKSL